MLWAGYYMLIMIYLTIHLPELNFWTRVAIALGGGLLARIAEKIIDDS